MKLSLVASICLLLLAGRAAAQSDPQGANSAAPASPGTAAPTTSPPAPPEQPPSPPASATAQAAPAPDATQAATGQWVYTAQYGWIWMPYGTQYVYEPEVAGAYPYAYVYDPTWAAWTWVVSPWVWGWGPQPWFGVFGAARFGWYRGPHFHHGFGGWAGGHGGAFWNGRWYGPRAAPPRGSWGRGFAGAGARPYAGFGRVAGGGFRGGAPSHFSGGFRGGGAGGFRGGGGGGHGGGGHGGGHR